MYMQYFSRYWPYYKEVCKEQTILLVQQSSMHAHEGQQPWMLVVHFPSKCGHSLALATDHNYLHFTIYIPLLGFALTHKKYGLCKLNLAITT